MADDLLSRIRVEMQERMRALYPAVQESERLLADLRALEGEHRAGASESGSHESGSYEVERIPATLAAVATARESSPVRPLVSPKVMRLMGTTGPHARR